MITDSRLKYCVSFSGLDFYEYEVRLGRYFFIPMAYYEKLWTRKVRETMDYIRGNYHVYYIAKGNELIGYGTIVRGGGDINSQRKMTSYFVIYGSNLVLEAMVMQMF